MIPRHYRYNLSSSSSILSTKSVSSAINRSRITYTKMLLVKVGGIQSLVDYHYTISNCLINLRLLKYASDLYSADFLSLALRQLPSKLYADGVNTVWNFEKLVNQISFTYKQNFTTESKLKTIQTYHQIQPSKTIHQRKVTSQEVIDKNLRQYNKDW